MTLHPLDLAVISTYFVTLTVFGILVRRISGFEDFAVAQRSVPMLMVFASLCGAFLGPGYSLGFTAKAFSAGFALLPVWFCFSLQTCLVGIWLAPRLRNYHDAHTLGGVMMISYGPIAKSLTGAVSVGLCVGFAGVIARAGGTVLANAIGVSLPIAILLVTGVGVIYAWTGGLKSVIATEGIQFGVVLLSVGFVVLFAAQRIHSYPSLDHIAVAMTVSTWRAMPTPEILGLMLLFLLGETLIPPYANRALAAESPAASRGGFLIAGIFSVVWFTMMAVAGIMARALLGSVPQPDSVLIQLAREVLPSGLLGLFLVALAAIVMSTQESLLNAASVCMTRDLIPSRWSEKNPLLIARIGTLLFAVAATWLGLRAPSIIDGLLVCYSIWAPTVLPSLIWALAGFRTSNLGGVLSILGGGITSASILVFHIASGDPAIAILAGLSASIVCGMAGVVSQRIARFA